MLNVKFSDLLPLQQVRINVNPEFHADIKVLKEEYAAEYEFQQSDCSSILEISGNFAELPGGDKSVVMVIPYVTQAKRLEAEN